MGLIIAGALVGAFLVYCLFDYDRDQKATSWRSKHPITGAEEINQVLEKIKREEEKKKNKKK